MNRKEISDGVEEMKKWLSSQPHIPPCASDDEQLLEGFVVGCRSVDLAKLKLDAYFTLRGEYLDLFFNNRDPKSIKWESIQKYFLLPGETPAGDLVIFTVLPSEEEMKTFSAAEAAKVKFMLLDSYLREHHDKSYGLYIITDMAHLSQRLVQRLDQQYSRQFSQIMEAYPFRVKGMLSFNAPAQRQAVPEKNHFETPCFHHLQQTVRIFQRGHESVTEFIPIEMLPCDYEGGKNLPIKALCDAMRQRLERERDWFVTAGSQTTNENLRP